MSELLVLGAGGHALDVVALIQLAKPASKIYLSDDADIDQDKFGSSATALKESIQALDLSKFKRVIVGVGYPKPRSSLANRVGNAPWCEALIAPSADVSSRTELSRGCLIFGQSWVSPMVRIGMHCHIGYGSTIGHETVLGNFCAVMPASNIGGEVLIGDRVLIGANSTILQGIKIGDDAVIGAGAVVTKDVSPKTTVIGVPARQVTINTSASR